MHLSATSCQARVVGLHLVLGLALPGNAHAFRHGLSDDPLIGLLQLLLIGLISTAPVWLPVLALVLGLLYVLRWRQREKLRQLQADEAARSPSNGDATETAHLTPSAQPPEVEIPLSRRIGHRMFQQHLSFGTLLKLAACVILLVWTVGWMVLAHTPP